MLCLEIPLSEVAWSRSGKAHHPRLEVPLWSPQSPLPIHTPLGCPPYSDHLAWFECPMFHYTTVVDPEIVEWGREPYHMATIGHSEGGLGRCGRGIFPLLKESVKAKDILYAKH